jgi:hypothetical protein
MSVTLKKIKATIPCFVYLGVDVVSSVIAKNTDTFSQEYLWMKFAEMDLSTYSPVVSSSLLRRHSSSTNTTITYLSSLPSGFQLILSRDALQHLSYAAIAGALSHYCASGASYLLVGSYILNPPETLSGGTGKNKNIAIGETFSIDLLRAPFLFPHPLEIFPERPIGAYSDAQPENAKFLLLYNLPTLCSSQSLRGFLHIYRS